jgi:nicotinamide-nucleotide amidase
MMNEAVLKRAAEVFELCRAGGRMVATAESCTGGLLAAALTSMAGSSAVFERGFVAYTNESKTELLGVPRELVQFRGAVSEEVAYAMAENALGRSRADIAVSITGIAGPGGGTKDKPVGLVWFGWADRTGMVATERHVFAGNRTAVRVASVINALDIIVRVAER